MVGFGGLTLRGAERPTDYRAQATGRGMSSTTGGEL